MVGIHFDVLKVLGGRLSIFDLAYDFGRPKGWELVNSISQLLFVCVDLLTHCVVLL